MAKLSVIIPSRDERFLTPTIDDIFAHAEGEIEVVAVLDSEKWPGDWKEVSDRHPNLHTIHNGTPRGMRYSINAGVASAVSRGAKYVMKLDAHCSLSQGFDEALKADCDKDWVVVPRRGRLDPENWIASDTHKPDIDYHYLSFPNDPDDFGGPGLNGKVWDERAIERKDILVDDEMSSQGSCWFMYADYFRYLDLMDEVKWGTFWCEFQEIGFHAWLSGGQVKVNKNAKYLHLHKGKKYGRGYKLNEKELQKGRTAAMLWPWNEDGWPKQSLPFSWLIEHFWPVPTWPDNWEEILYATRKPRVVGVSSGNGNLDAASSDSGNSRPPTLKIVAATYGIGAGLGPNADFDVTERLQNLAYLNNDSLDIVVNNSTLCPGQNPHRGKKKSLTVTYQIDGGEYITRDVAEKDWLIIGPVQDKFDKGGLVQENMSEAMSQLSPDLKIHSSQPVLLDARTASELIIKFCGRCGREVQLQPDGTIPIHAKSAKEELREVNPTVCSGSGKKYEAVVTVREVKPSTAPALNDYLIRKFQISPQRLRGPMPIELRDFHRNDLAQLFAELGFKRMVEVGVAEGHFSEVLLKANPEAELILVDPWGDVEGNAQNKGSNRHKFAYEETKRKTAPYPNVRILKNTSMGVVGGFLDNSFDAAYLDANHSYPFIMEDLVNWTRKVRSGGIVAGDDAFKLDEKRWGAGPMEAIFDYTRAMRISPWWLIDAPRSVDFFFVKP